eukprot:403333067
MSKLSEAVQKISQQKNQGFISKDKLSLNFNHIHTLDTNHPITRKYLKVQKLFLSHNPLFTLQGLQKFQALSHLSLSHCKLQDIEELTRLNDPSALECLAVKGNYIDRHPDYKALIIQFFKNLKELDGMIIDGKVREQIRDGTQLKRNIMSFLYKIDQKIVKLANQLNALEIREDKMTEITTIFQEIQEQFAVVFNLKDIRKLPKRDNKDLNLLTSVQAQTQLDQDTDYLKAIDKAISVLQEDPQVNYEVLLQEQLKEFYLLQPEQATLADNYYFIEKNTKDGNISTQNEVKFQVSKEDGRQQQHYQSQGEKQSSLMQGNPFRVRSESHDKEILPDKSIQHSNDRTLKMNIPKSILKSSQDLTKNMLVPKHVNFDSQDTSNNELLDSNLLLNSQQNQSQQAFTDRSNLSDITQYNPQTQKILKKFLKGDWDLDYSGEDFLIDKVLLEFPTFSLNDDYMRAIANIIFVKIEQIQNIINQKNGDIQACREAKEYIDQKKLRDESLKIIKGKQSFQRDSQSPSMNNKNRVSNSRGRQIQRGDHSLERDNSSSTPQEEPRKMNFKPTNKDKIDNWIVKQQRKQQVQQCAHIMSHVLTQVFNTQVQSSFNQLLLFQSSLLQKQNQIESNTNQTLSSKLFYKWFEAYYQSLERSYKHYYKTLKRKVFRWLVINKRQKVLKESKALQLLQQNLQFKGYLGFLQNLNKKKLLRKKRQNKLEKEMQENARQLQNEYKSEQKDQTYKSRLVDVVPIIDRDLRNVYQRELSPHQIRASISNNSSQPRNQSPLYNILNSDDNPQQNAFNIFNKNEISNSLPKWFNSNGTNNPTIQMTNQSLNLLPTPDNYSPVRNQRMNQNENNQTLHKSNSVTSSFNWKLQTNQSKEAVENPFIRNTNEKENQNQFGNQNQDLQQQYYGTQGNSDRHGVFSFQNTNQPDFQSNTMTQGILKNNNQNQRAISPYFDRQVQFFLGKGQPISSQKQLIPYTQTLNSTIDKQGNKKPFVHQSQKNLHQNTVSSQNKNYRDTSRSLNDTSQYNSYKKYTQLRSPQKYQANLSPQNTNLSQNFGLGQGQQFTSAAVRMTYKNNEKAFTGESQALQNKITKKKQSKQKQNCSTLDNSMQSAYQISGRSGSRHGREPSYTRNTVSFISKHIDN